MSQSRWGKAWSAIWGGMGGLGLVIAAIVRVHLAQEKESTQVPKAKIAPGPIRAHDRPALGAAIPKLHIESRVSTDEVKALAAHLSPDEKMKSGLFLLRFGNEFDGIHVQVSNTGTVPVAVDPQKLALRCLGATVTAIPITHPRFLKATLLEPGQSMEGFVLFLKCEDAKVGMRSGTILLIYQDPATFVSYPSP